MSDHMHAHQCLNMRITHDMLHNATTQATTKGGVRREEDRSGLVILSVQWVGVV